MKICFIETPFDWVDRKTEKIASYGFERIISLINYNYYYVDMTLQRYNIDEIPKCEIYAFSVMQPNYKSTKHWINKLRKRDPKSIYIVGGPSVSDHHSKILEIGADIAIQGFAEDSFLKIIEGNKLEDIPNIYFKKGREVITTKKLYPPLNWKIILPKKIYPIKRVNYKKHAMVLASIGCGYFCNFCNIIKQQPHLYEREDKYIIQEIEMRIKQEGEISIQIIHQNFCQRLPKLLEKLSEKKLLSKIKSIAFNTRLDTINESILEKSLNYDVFLILYTGVENFNDNMLKRLNKGYSSQIAEKKVRYLIDLEKRHDNFDFLMTFIGFDKKTTIEEFKENMDVFYKLFIQKNCFKPIHHFFTSGLRKPLKNEIYQFPENELSLIIKEYIKLSKLLPDYSLRRDIYFKNILKGKNQLILIWAEYMLMDSLLNKKDSSKIIEDCNYQFKMMS